MTSSGLAHNLKRLLLTLAGVGRKVKIGVFERDDKHADAKKRLEHKDSLISPAGHSPRAISPTLLNAESCPPLSLGPFFLPPFPICSRVHTKLVDGVERMAGQIEAKFASELRVLQR